jgi:hypothetical protein
MILQTKTIAAPYSVVYSGDDALIQPTGETKGERATSEAAFAEQLRLFRETGDTVHLPLQPGLEPTVFVLHHLEGQAYTRLRDLIETGMAGGHARETYYRMVQMCLREVKGERTEQGGCYKLRMAVADGGIPAVHPDSMADIVRVGKDADLLVELGLSIIVETLGRD